MLGSNDLRALRESDLRTADCLRSSPGRRSRRRGKSKQVARTARVDQLTGLGNRRDFDDELKRTLDQTDRFGGSCALVMADVDHFKQ